MEEGIEVKRGPLQRNLTKIGLVYHFCNKAIKQKPKSIIYMNVNFANFFGSVRSSGCQSVCLSVCPSGTSLSNALNLHLSLIVLSQVSLRSLSAYFVRQMEPKILHLVTQVPLGIEQDLHKDNPLLAVVLKQAL